MLEFVRVDVERDARACMAKLAGRANRIDALTDQVTRERESEIVKPELGHVVALEVCRLSRSIEAALCDVVAVEGRPRRGSGDAVARRCSRRYGSS